SICVWDGGSAALPRRGVRSGGGQGHAGLYGYAGELAGNPSRAGRRWNGLDDAASIFAVLAAGAPGQSQGTDFLLLHRTERSGLSLFPEAVFVVRTAGELSDGEGHPSRAGASRVPFHSGGTRPP